MRNTKTTVLLCLSLMLLSLTASVSLLSFFFKTQADAAVFMQAASENTCEDTYESPVLFAPQEPSQVRQNRLASRQEAKQEVSVLLEDMEPGPIPAPEPKCVYDALQVSFSDKELLAGTVCNEAGSEPFDGQVAVVQVALNRCLHPAFPDTVREVLCAPYQFVEGTVYTQTHMDAVEAALSGYDVLDGRTDVVFFPTGCLRYGVPYKWICCHEFRTYQ